MLNGGPVSSLREVAADAAKDVVPGGPWRSTPGFREILCLNL